MNFKYLYSLIEQCPKLKDGLRMNAKFHNFLMSRRVIHLFTRSISLQMIKCSDVLRFHSHVANQETHFKDSQNAVEVQPLQFEEVLFDQAVSHEELIAALQKYESVVEQMNCLVQTLALSAEDIKKREQFCKTIESLFQPFFNEFKIQMFGSTVNSFGFKGCDLDLTFETTAKHKNMTHYLERPDVPLVSEVLSGKVSVQELSELPLKEQLLFIHSVFLEFYKESEVPAKFINAHVPLIRFYHDRYNLKCDLTMKNKVAFANTKLLYLYAKLDKRVVPLMMTIRYWAKHAELIGKGLMFNTYTISLLVIYFLQTRNPPIIPSAEYVLSLSSDKLNTDDMKDKSFLDLVNEIPETKNNESLETLLKEFFFFYLYFDFTKVIRPLTASAEPRELFFSKEENNRFRLNTICVQDPLCLSHNIAELVDYKHCRKFFAELIVICKMFQNENQSLNKFNLVTIFEKPQELLYKISFDKAVSLELPLVHRDPKQSTDEKVLSSAEKLLQILKNVLLFDCQTYELKNVIHLLRKQDELVAQQRKDWEERNRFRFRAEEAIPHLKNRRNRNLTEEIKENISKNKMNEESLLEQFQNFNLTHKLVLCAECKVTKNTWLGRDSIDWTDLSLDKLLAQEKLISEYVAKENAINYTEKNIKPFFFLFECYTDPTISEKLIVNFRPLQKMSFNPILGIFLKEFLPKLMMKLNG